MADIQKLQQKHREYLVSKGLDVPELLTWHNKRRAGLGGSDIGAILGVNPYKSAYDLFGDNAVKCDILYTWIEEQEFDEEGNYIDSRVVAEPTEMEWQHYSL